jgi:hypothetical protein
MGLVMPNADDPAIVGDQGLAELRQLEGLQRDEQVFRI